MKMNNILQKIVARKHEEIAERALHTTIEHLKDQENYVRKPYSLKERIQLADKPEQGIIAEFKRASPSKGLINGHVQLEEVVRLYAESGAAGVSVLTDEDFFHGSLGDLNRARAAVPIPLLRKDFIVDPYQIVEAKACGADCILLIAAALEPELLRDLSLFAKELDLEVLMEIHRQEELEANCWDSVDLIGVNNRNLHTFQVDLQHSMHLANMIPNRYPKIAESGLDQVETIRLLHQAGFQGFLIGEFFMRQENPGQAMKNFCTNLAK